MNKIRTIIAIFTLLNFCTNFSMKRGFNKCNINEHNEMRSLEKVFKKQRTENKTPLTGTTSNPMEIKSPRSVVDYQYFALLHLNRAQFFTHNNQELTNDDLKTWLEVL